VNELLNEKTIPELSEEMVKLATRIEHDLLSTLVALSGSLKDIECGTHIKIPMDAGYVSYYKSVESESITFWLKHDLMSEWKVKRMKAPDKCQFYNTDEDGYTDKDTKST